MQSAWNARAQYRHRHLPTLLKVLTSNMNPNIVKIADLSHLSKSRLENVTIKASVSIRSLRHGNDGHGYFYMDLRDDSGDIPAVAYTYSEPCDSQLHLIQDNRTYMITNISLVNSNKRYTTKEKEIVLNDKSVIKLCGNAPKLEWPLTPLKEVYDRDETTLFNIVGLCIKVSKTEVVHGEPTRAVTLVDEAYRTIVLKVWNSETSLFDELDLNFHPVLFVKDARIHKYRGTTSVTTSRYLQLLHPDDPRAAKIRRAMQGILSRNGSEVRIVEGGRTPAGYPYCTPANYTRNNQKYVTIAELDRVTITDNITLIATVTIKSTSYIVDKNKIFFCMELYDDSGEIVAVAGNDACVKFQNFIENNKTYSFTGFTLRGSNRKATSVPHNKILCLENDADVKLCGIAPRVEWPLSPVTVVQAEDKTKFFHAFGLYTGIHGNFVTLVDQLGRDLLLKIGDEDSAMFAALDLETRPVFFAKDAVRSNIKHEGNKILETISYLELLDPDDPRACSVTEVLDDAA